MRPLTSAASVCVAVSTVVTATAGTARRGSGRRCEHTHQKLLNKASHPTIRQLRCRGCRTGTEALARRANMASGRGYDATILRSSADVLRARSEATKNAHAACPWTRRRACVSSASSVTHGAGAGGGMVTMHVDGVWAPPVHRAHRNRRRTVTAELLFWRSHWHAHPHQHAAYRLSAHARFRGLALATRWTARAGRYRARLPATTRQAVRQRRSTAWVATWTGCT